MSKKTQQTTLVPQWDNKIGMSAVLGILQIVALFVGGGVLWGMITTKLDVATTNVIDLKQTTAQITKDAARRDEHFAAQNERIGKIETSVGFMQQGIQRIEAALSK